MKYSFTYNGTLHRVSVTNNNSPSNYNRMLWVYRIGEKMPLVGFACKHTDTKEILHPQVIKTLSRNF